MISFEEIRESTANHCLVTPGDIAVLPREHIRIGTKLIYPDGSGVDLFVEMGNLARTHGYAVSDFGRTFAKLAEYQMNLRSSKSRQETIHAMTRPFKIEVMRDRLVVVLDRPDDLGDGLIRLGQACISVSSLVFTRKKTGQTTLLDEVRLVIEQTNFNYIIKFPHDGPYNKSIQVDYRVTSPTKTTSVLTLGPRHEQAADAFNKWSDLKYANVKDHLLTIFDDRSGYERSDDLARLERVSEVLSIRNPKLIENSLGSAA